MKLEIGKLLNPKNNHTEESSAEIVGYNNRTNKWHILINDEFDEWLTKEQIEKDFDEYE